MMSVVMPMSGRARRNFSMSAEETLARVAAVHQFQDAVAAALDGQMRAFDQLGQPRIGLNQIVTVALRMRRGEADTFQPVDCVDGVQELDEGGFPAVGTRCCASWPGGNSALPNPRLP